MAEYDADREFARGVAELKSGASLAAMVHFERAANVSPRPLYRSYLGYCLAKERGQIQAGLDCCKQALAEESANPELYLNLGRTHLLAGNKVEALKILRDGLTVAPHPGIVALLDSLGIRKQPLFPFLSRTNPLNRYLGKFLTKLGLR